MNYSAETLREIVFVNSIINYLVFIVAAYSFFKRRQNPTQFMIILKTSAVLSLILQFLVLKGNTNVNVVSLLMSSIGLVISIGLFFYTMYSTRRLSEMFSTDTPKFLTVVGPYRIVRHPFYCSYLMSYFSGAIGGGFSVILIAQAIFMTCLYVYAAKFEEAKFMKSPLAEQYRKYKCRTGMLIPNLFKMIN